MLLDNSSGWEGVKGTVSVKDKDSFTWTLTPAELLILVPSSDIDTSELQRVQKQKYMFVEMA